MDRDVYWCGKVCKCLSLRYPPALFKLLYVPYYCPPLIIRFKQTKKKKEPKRNEKRKVCLYHWTLHWMDCGKTVFALLQYAAHGIRPDLVWSTITVIPTLLPPVILLRN